MFNLKFGSDPELFVRHKKTGSIVSVHNMIPGTKKEPHKVPGGAIQVDGVAAEINIDPVSTVGEWIDNHNKVLKELQYYLGDSYEMVIEPVAFFPVDYFKLLPPETQALGCDPDYNAWLGNQNPPPNSGSDLVTMRDYETDETEDFIMRTASGHVHIGWTSGRSADEEFHRNQCFELVKQLDKVLGIRSSQWDSDTRRRKLYGRAGACRIKPYGVEYRVPSNRWLTDEQLMARAYLFTHLAATRFFLGKTVSLDDVNQIKARLG